MILGAKKSVCWLNELDLSLVQEVMICSPYSISSLKRSLSQFKNNNNLHMNGTLHIFEYELLVVWSIKCTVFLIVPVRLLIIA